MDIAARSLKTKRTVISRLLDEGLYPYTKRYLGTFANHFSTIGLLGMNEVGLNAKWLGKDMTDPKTQEFTKKVLNHMRERLSDYQEEYGDLYNLEATPAESTTYRFAKHDVQRYPDIKTANMNGTPYYTNKFASARGIHGRYFRRAGHSGRIADAVHFGHGIATHSSAKNSPIGKPRRRWSGRSRRTINCPIIPFPHLLLLCPRTDRPILRSERVTK